VPVAEVPIERGQRTAKRAALELSPGSSAQYLIASDQDQTWSDDDQKASGRAQRTADAEQRVADAAFAAGSDGAAHERGVLARRETRRQRGSATVSRDETSAARLQEHDDAEADRENPLWPSSAGKGQPAIG